MLDSLSTLYSDRTNVVHHSLLPLPERSSGKRSYSGMVMHANNIEGDLAESVIKVKAHRDVDELGISERDRFLRMRTREPSTVSSCTHLMPTEI